ncbi:MAG: PorT family protein [Sphingobacteriales bacterium]|nr:MAG: PorT family protein [Sphingobacteriales bacterium]TAF82702.1 MAG: PorT family protein [Sphingobacteriales bacterium]
MIKLKILLSTTFVMLSGSLLAQGNFGGGVDDEDIHFGFTFQYISSEYKIVRNNNWQSAFLDPEKGFTSTTGEVKSIRSIPNPGFGIGFVANAFITKNVDFRFTPTLAFTDRVVDYEFKNAKTFDQPGLVSPDGYTRRVVSAVMMEFPVGIKLKSERRNNFRAYILGGIKYGTNIASRKKEDDNILGAEFKFLKNNKNILSYEAGIGFDLYFEFFKLSPEIKISNSINSVLRSDYTPYANPIEKMYLRNFQFSLYFE